MTKQRKPRKVSQPLVEQQVQEPVLVEEARKADWEQAHAKAMELYELQICISATWKERYEKSSAESKAAYDRLHARYARLHYRCLIWQLLFPVGMLLGALVMWGVR